MDFPLTYATFAVLTAGLVLLRIFWRRFHPLAQSALILCALAFPLAEVLTHATGWSFTSGRLNSILYWGGVASYEFAMLLFTLLRPVWLTSLVAAILIVPVLSASIFFPMIGLFVRSGGSTVETLGHHLVCDHSVWYSNSDPTRVAGVDLSIQYRPSFAPFIRQEHQKDRLYNSQCNTSATTVTLQPDGQSVLIHCPPWPGEPSTHSVHVVVNLY